MTNEPSRMQKRWQLYEVTPPGGGFTRFVVTSSLKRALEMTITDNDELSAGQMMLAANVTLSFLGGSNQQTANHTWGLLKEAREDLVEFDYNSGWTRIEPGAYD